MVENSLHAPNPPSPSSELVSQILQLRNRVVTCNASAVPLAFTISPLQKKFRMVVNMSYSALKSTDQLDSFKASTLDAIAIAFRVPSVTSDSPSEAVYISSIYNTSWPNAALSKGNDYVALEFSACVSTNFSGNNKNASLPGFNLEQNWVDSPLNYWTVISCPAGEEACSAIPFTFFTYNGWWARLWLTNKAYNQWNRATNSAVRGAHR